MNGKPANDNLPYSATLVRLEMDQMLAAYPELLEDSDLRADMFEAETNLHDVLSRILAVELDANSMVAAIADRAKELAARRARYEVKKEAMRKLLLSLLKHSDLAKVTLPEATVSVGKGRDSVDIVDEAALPRAYLRVVTSPDKTAIKVALDAGKKVRGAAIKTGEDVLTVRVS